MSTQRVRALSCQSGSDIEKGQEEEWGGTKDGDASSALPPSHESSFIPIVSGL